MTAAASSVVTACVLVAVQWFTAPGKPPGSAVDAGNGQQSRVPDSTTTSPAEITAPSQPPVTSLAASQTPTPSSVPAAFSNPSPPPSTLPGTPRGQTPAAGFNRTTVEEASRKLRERLARGEVPTVAEFAAAGITITEEQRRQMFADVPALRPTTPEGSAPSTALTSNSGSTALPTGASTASTKNPPAASSVADAPAKDSPEASANPVGKPSSEMAANVAPAGLQGETASKSVSNSIHPWADVKASLRIPLPRAPGDDSAPSFSGLRPQYVQFKRSLYEVNTGRVVAKLPAEFSSDRALVSSDGAYIVRYNGAPGARLTTLYVHPVKTPETFVRIDCTRFRSVHAVRLISAGQLLVIGETSSSDRWVIWNIETGEEVCSFQMADFNSSSIMDVNPEGTRLLLGYLGSAQVYDLMTGQIDAQLQKPESLSPSEFLHVRHMCFSPDGHEIVGIIHPSQIAVWSSDGTLLLHESIPSDGRTYLSTETGISWLPDSSGWLVGGELIDRKTMSVIWQFGAQLRSSDRSAKSCFLSQDQVLVVGGEDDSRELMPLRIPWDKINEKLKPVHAQQPLELKPGSAVSLFVQVGQLRLANNEQVSVALQAAGLAMLQTAGLKEAANQPVRLVVRHDEAPVQSRVRNRMFSLLAGGGPGEGVSDTQVITTIELQDAKTDVVYWRSQTDSEGWFHARDNVSEQGLRDAAFNHGLELLKQVALPSKLYPVADTGLPIQSIVP